MMELGSTDAGKEVVEELRNVIPGIWLAGVEKEATFDRSVFDEVITTQPDAVFGRYEKIDLAQLAVDPKLASLVAPAEGRLLNALEIVSIKDPRRYPKPLRGVPVFKDSYSARKDLLNRHLCFWNYVFDSFRIDAVIHENLGQEGYDFVALTLARAKNIPTLTFNICGQFPRTLFVQEDEHGLGSLNLGEKLKALAAGISTYESTDFIRRSIPAIKESPNARLMAQSAGYPTGALLSWLFDRSIHRGKTSSLGIPRMIVRKLTRFSRDPKRGWQNFQRSRLLARTTRQNQLEERSVCQTLKPAENFLYFPLQFQPETATSVKARSFYRTREAVAYVAKMLPKDWRLVVKEHPHQFRRLLPRDHGFYSQIASIPNVIFVHHATDNELLVRRAQGLVTISHSSISAHALFNSKPVISLGESHFREAPGYFCVQSDAELGQAIAFIESGLPPSSCGDFEVFVKRLESSCIEGELGEKPNEMSIHEWNRILRTTRTSVARMIREWLISRNLGV